MQAKVCQGNPMNKLKLSQYETAFLNAIIRNHPAWAEYLTDQIQNLEVVSREYTGGGSYVDFYVDADKVLKRFENIPHFFDVDVVAPDASDAAVFMLYTQLTDDGKTKVLHFLEIAIAGTRYDEAEVYSWLISRDTH